jgi:serine/threonine-protein kinase
MSEGLVLAARYRLVRQLGAGGMGSVWLAEDLNLGAEIAIKLIDPTVAESTEAVDRFRREAQSAAMIRSTHVVQIIDYGVDLGRPFIAMELLRGEDLSQRLEREHVVNPEDTARILGQVGRALSLAHASGIVHRDLKPDNVFLAREGDVCVAKILDFGIARRACGLTDSAVSRTRTGAMLGTPYYMSPEQATAQHVDYATDIWSFGVIAFECLTGRHAFEGETVGSLFHAICISPIVVPSQVAPVPAGFDRWFARAVVRDKTQRFPSIKEAAESLWLICGAHTGDMAEFTGQRAAVPFNDSLSTTAVAVLSTSLEDTGFPSSNTVGRRIQRRPLWAFLGGLGFLIAALVGYGLWGDPGTKTARPTPLTSSQPLPAAAAMMPSLATSVGSLAAPPAEPAAPNDESLVARDAAKPAGTSQSLQPTKVPVHAANQAKSTKSTKSAKSAKPTEPTEPTKPSKSFVPTPPTPPSRDDNAAGI